MHHVKSLITPKNVKEFEQITFNITRLKTRLSSAFLKRVKLILSQKQRPRPLYLKCLTDLNFTISLTPTIDSLYYYRSLVYKKLKEYGKSRDDVNKALELSGYSKKSFFVLAKEIYAVLEVELPEVIKSKYESLGEGKEKKKSGWRGRVGKSHHGHGHGGNKANFNIKSSPYYYKPTDKKRSERKRPKSLIISRKKLKSMFKEKKAVEMGVSEKKKNRAAKKQRSSPKLKKKKNLAIDHIKKNTNFSSKSLTNTNYNDDDDENELRRSLHSNKSLEDDDLEDEFKESDDIDFNHGKKVDNAFEVKTFSLPRKKIGKIKLPIAKSFKTDSSPFFQNDSARDINMKLGVKPLSLRNIQFTKSVVNLCFRLISKLVNIGTYRDLIVKYKKELKANYEIDKALFKILIEQIVENFDFSEKLNLVFKIFNPKNDKIKIKNFFYSFIIIFDVDIEEKISLFYSINGNKKSVSHDTIYQWLNNGFNIGITLAGILTKQKIPDLVKLNKKKYDDMAKRFKKTDGSLNSIQLRQFIRSQFNENMKIWIREKI